MRPVKRVEFTIARAEVWPWIKAIVSALWRGDYRINLTLKGEQTFIYEPDERSSSDRKCCGYHSEGGDTYADCWHPPTNEGEQSAD